MKCNQVDDLLFSYCDRQEIPLRIRQELEEHLNECPECRRKADFTAREREALVYDGDIPEMSPDFTRRVMTAIAQGHVTTAPSWGMRLRSQIGSRGWWAMGMVAAIVISWVMLPGSFKNPVNTVDINNQMADTGKQRNIMVADKMLTKEATPELEKMSAGFGYTGRESERIEVGRGNPSSPVAPPGEVTAVADQVTVFRPSYLPSNYHLIRIESDAKDSISLYYENDQGGYICLKTLPGLEENKNTVETRNSGSSLAMNEQKKEARNQSDPTVIRWTCEREQTLYRLELTGSLPPEELARVAASVK